MQTSYYPQRKGSSFKAPKQIALTIWLKIIIGYSIVLLLIVIIGIINWYCMLNLSQSYQDISNNNLQGAIQLANAQNALWQLRYGVSQFLSSDAAARKRIFGDSDKWYQQIDQNLAAYQSSSRSPEEQLALKDWQAAFAVYRNSRPHWFELQFAGKPDEATAWRAKTIFPFGQKAVDALEHLINLQRQVSNQRMAGVLSYNRTISNVMITCTVLAILLGIGIALQLSRHIAAPILLLTNGANAVEQGRLDTSVPVTTRDELGTLTSTFNRMVKTLKQQKIHLEEQVHTAEHARIGAEQAQAQITEQFKMIEAQQALIHQMSVPILPLTDTTLVMPIVGNLDSHRIDLIQQQLFPAITQASTRCVVLDITGVPLVDSQVAQALMRIMQGVRLLGCEIVVTGVRPEVAQAIVGLGIDMRHLRTQSTLQSGIASVLRQFSV